MNHGNPNYQKLHYHRKRISHAYLGTKVLNDLLFEKDLYQKYVCYNLCLPKKDGSYFNLNALIITPYVLYLIVVVHVENELNFNTIGKFTYTNNGETITVPNPLSDANIQIEHLHQFLEQHGLPPIPLHPIVTFTHPKVMLNFDRNFDDMVHIKYLLKRITALRSIYQKRFYQIDQLEHLANQLKNQHRAKNYNLIDKHHIPAHDIRNGVWCLKCKLEMMHRKHGYWKCKACNNRSDSAHIKALHEYQLLYRTAITNKEARHFLQVESAKVVTSLFTSLNIKQSGTAKTSSYHLDTLSQ
ncbi:NERD domain-containing protein [Paraliobacillus sediminis]|uniref:NERD domain-containing protein n=1 Tax=Paraliobacillus sediminis TaxID=1885916 RepID=UPI0013C36A52|nr:NERD domain-containing protein [Paraliobacillus sediminis]